MRRNGRNATYWNIGLGADEAVREGQARVSAAVIQRQEEELVAWIDELNGAIRGMEAGIMDVAGDRMTRAMAQPSNAAQLERGIRNVEALLGDPRAPSSSRLVLPSRPVALQREEVARIRLIPAWEELEWATGGRVRRQPQTVVLGTALRSLVPSSFTSVDVDRWWRELMLDTMWLKSSLDKADWVKSRENLTRIDTHLTDYGKFVDGTRPAAVTPALWAKLSEYVASARAMADRARREIPKPDAASLREAAARLGFRSAKGSTPTSGGITPLVVVGGSSTPTPINDVGPRTGPEVLWRLQDSMRAHPLLWLAGVGVTGLIIYKVIR